MDTALKELLEIVDSIRELESKKREVVSNPDFLSFLFNHFPGAISINYQALYRHRRHMGY